MSRSSRHRKGNGQTDIPRFLLVVPAVGELENLSALLNDDHNVTLMCGSVGAGVHNDVFTRAHQLKASVVHARRCKEHLEWENPYDVGMIGLIDF